MWTVSRACCRTTGHGFRILWRAFPTSRERPVRSACARHRKIRQATDNGDGAVVAHGFFVRSQSHKMRDSSGQRFRTLTSRSMRTFMFSVSTVAALVLIAILGHVMALIWYLAATGKWKTLRTNDLRSAGRQRANSARNAKFDSRADPRRSAGDFRLHGIL